MSLRVYVGPTESPRANFFRATASKYMGAYVNFFPSKADGTPASSWVVTIGSATDWTAADADVTITNVFASELTGTELTQADLVAALRAHTFGSVGVVRETALRAFLTAQGVPNADLLTTDTFWRVFQRVVSILLERDDNWGKGWSF